jgi:hypothetical protein
MLTFVRHSKKANYDKDSAEKWRRSKRYKQNQFDVPLSPDALDIANVEFPKFITHCDYKYIITSPATRCIQTSIFMQKYIKKHFNVHIPIAIENGMMFLTYGVDVDLLFINNDVHNVVIKSDGVHLLDNTVKYIDNKLLPHNIYEKYGKKRFCTTYKSFMSADQINTTSSALKCANSRIKTYKYLTGLANKHGNMLVCTHGEVMNVIKSFVNKKWNYQTVVSLCGSFTVDTKKGKIIEETSNDKQVVVKYT